MTDVNLSVSGPPETHLPLEPDDVARVAHGAPAREAAAAVVAAWPRSCLAWALVGDAERDEIARYAAYRVGYHRGLDALRANGWRGSGYVRWAHEPNRGFLRCVDGLRAMAVAIGEVDEAERCALFLRQLDPSWPPADLAPAHGA